MKRILLPLFFSLLLTVSCGRSIDFKTVPIDFVSADTVFTAPFIDTDSLVTEPVPCRYIHGGFGDGTRFSCYFPEKKAYKGRFFQYITPFPDSETAAQNYPLEMNPIAFSITHGAYFVETNEGGAMDFTTGYGREASIGAYRANAACAEFSRWIAERMYGCDRPYGYCFGGSGGAYRTTGGMEMTEGVWDGAVPFVLGSPQAIPNVFAVRMRALRVLKDKLPDIIDAMEPGGSGDPYATLNPYEAEVLKESSAMGFPLKSWYGWRYMDVHGFLVLYQSIVQMDGSYFRHDFWNEPGYDGHDHPEAYVKDRVQIPARVVRILGQQEAESIGLVAPVSEAERGTADRAWASMGTGIAEKPVAYELDKDLRDIGMGGDLIILSGEGQGFRLQITKAEGRYVALAAVNSLDMLKGLKVGDRVQVDNSDFLAVQTYYRHQVPGPEYHVWDQFRGAHGTPKYPQRPMLLGPLFTMGASGCIPDGDFHGKMIMLISAWDRESYAWQGDWFYGRVKAHKGDATDDCFRLWYTDRALHGDTYADDPTHAVSYMPTLFQALLDVADWAEKGIEPSHTTDYKILDGQTVLSEDGRSRGGVQPTVHASVNGTDVATAAPGEKVIVHVEADAPVGEVCKAEWCPDPSVSTDYSLPVDMSMAKYADSRAHASFDTEISYDKPGVYFPTVRVFSERHGNASTSFTTIPNLSSVRIIVK